MARNRFEPTWESLAQYRVPEWYRNAKLGIFIHWGVYAVPAFGNEWYPRNMYRRDQPEFEHHRKAWGPQSTFGYKDFIPLFKAGRWNPDAWAELFEQAGARYVVPVAEHHDGFPMYDCSFTDWNAVKRGPCRNIISELSTATRKRNLKFAVSSHRAFNWSYYTFEPDFDTVDPRHSGLYGPAHPPTPLVSSQLGELRQTAPQEFLKGWLARTHELVDKFQPDLVYFDWCFGAPEFEPYRREFAAYYYNRAAEWGTEPVINYKQDAFAEGTAVLDIERGKLSGIREQHWQTDTSVSYKSWGYIENDEFKSVTTLVHDLVDIVSKNGNLLLNVGPQADGTIPDEATQRLLGLGEWLRVNGEAIYDTRPWHTFGEGETSVVTTSFKEHEQQPFTASDIRFTTKRNTLYAICLGWPGREALIKSLGSGSPLSARQIAQIRLLGAQEPLMWSQDRSGLRIQLPAVKPCDHAFAYKIVLQ